MANPTAPSRPPTTCRGSQSRTQAAARQPVSSQGISPATVPGPTTKKAALPAAARCTLAQREGEAAHPVQDEPGNGLQRSLPGAPHVGEPLDQGGQGQVGLQARQWRAKTCVDPIP